MKCLTVIRVIHGARDTDAISFAESSPLLLPPKKHPFGAASFADRAGAALTRPGGYGPRDGSAPKKQPAHKRTFNQSCRLATPRRTNSLHG